MRSSLLAGRRRPGPGRGSAPWPARGCCRCCGSRPTSPGRGRWRSRSTTPSTATSPRAGAWPLATLARRAAAGPRRRGAACSSRAVSALLDRPPAASGERAAERIGARLRGAVFAAACDLSLRWHGRIRSGELVSRLTSDVGRLLDAVVAATVTLVPDLIARGCAFWRCCWCVDPDWPLLGLARRAGARRRSSIRQRRAVRRRQQRRPGRGRPADRHDHRLVRNVAAVQAFGRTDRAGRSFGAAQPRRAATVELARRRHRGAVGAAQRRRARGRRRDWCWSSAVSRSAPGCRPPGTCWWCSPTSASCTRRYAASPGCRVVLAKARRQRRPGRRGARRRRRWSPSRPTPRPLPSAVDGIAAGAACGFGYDPDRAGAGRLRPRGPARRDRLPVRSQRDRQEHRARAAAAALGRRRRAGSLVDGRGRPRPAGCSSLRRAIAYVPQDPWLLDATRRREHRLRLPRRHPGRRDGAPAAVGRRRRVRRPAAARATTRRSARAPAGSPAASAAGSRSPGPPSRDALGAAARRADGVPRPVVRPTG